MTGRDVVQQPVQVPEESLGPRSAVVGVDVPWMVRMRDVISVKREQNEDYRDGGFERTGTDHKVNA